MYLKYNKDIKEIVNDTDQKYKRLKYSYVSIREHLEELKNQKIINFNSYKKNGSRHWKNYFSLASLPKIESMWNSGLITNFSLTLDKIIWRYEQLSNNARSVMKKLLKTKAPWVDARKLKGSDGIGNYLVYYNGSNTLCNLITVGLNTSPKILEFYYELRNLYHCVLEILRILHPMYTEEIEPTIIEKHNSQATYDGYEEY